VHMGRIGKGKENKNLNMVDVMCLLCRSKCGNLKLAGALWEGDWEVGKRSGRDEPIWL
jgi:hypothetical protein